MIKTERNYMIAERHITQLRIVSGQAVGNQHQVRATLSCGNEVVLQSFETADEAVELVSSTMSKIDNI